MHGSNRAEENNVCQSSLNGYTCIYTNSSSGNIIIIPCRQFFFFNKKDSRKGSNSLNILLMPFVSLHSVFLCNYVITSSIYLISIQRKFALVYNSPGPYIRPVFQLLLCYASPTAALETQVPYLQNKTRSMLIYSR